MLWDLLSFLGLASTNVVNSNTLTASRIESFLVIVARLIRY